MDMGVLRDSHVSSTVDDQMTYGGGEVAPTGGQG